MTMQWDWNSFGAVGYLGVVVSLAVPVLWVIGRLRKGNPRLLVTAVGIAAVAALCGQINSTFHVNAIEPDRSAVEAAAKAAAEELHKRKLAAIDATREQAAADIRFAEDAKDDSLDKAGLDDGDLKYLEQIESEESATTPEWKKEKKTRGEGDTADDSLEAELDGDKAPSGMASGSTPEESKRPAIVVSEAAYSTAHRIDRWNLWWTRLLVVAAIAVLGYDWLRAANDYARAYSPMPVPSGIVNAMRPLAPLTIRPEPPRRTMPEELAWLLRRGDSFVYLAGTADAADRAEAALAAFEKRRRPVQVLRVGSKGEQCSNRFVFESVWFGRCSFIIADPARAERLVKDFCIFLEERRGTRAHARQTVHVVWDLAGAVPRDKVPAFVEAWKKLIQALSWRGRHAGFSVFLSRQPEPTTNSTKAENAA
jgi:hypothetical protein